MTQGKSTKPLPVIWPLLVSQTIGAFNDNAMKAMLPLMAAVQFGKASMDTVNQQVSILLILPFVVFAPFAGWIADRFSKKKVISYALLGQLLGLAVIGYAFVIQSLTLSMAGFFLLSVQSAFFSPAKKGILKELVGTNRLGKAVGFMEMLAMLGILGGAFSGALVFDLLVQEHGGWQAAALVCGLIATLAFASWVIAWPIPETASASRKNFNPRVLLFHFHDLFYILKKKKLRYPALGDAWFWGVGGFFYLVLVKLSGEVVSGDIGMGSLYGYWFLLLGLGIMVGSLYVAYLNHGRIELGLSAIGAMGMPLVFVGLYNLNPLATGFEICCFSLGFFGALFFVPLNAYLQDQAQEGHRGRVLSASNLLTQLFSIGMILLHTYLSTVLHLSSKQELAIIMVPAFIIGCVTLYYLFEDFCRAWLHMFLRVFYRIKFSGMENFPAQGGCLLVCNHLSFADPVFIGAAFPRKIRYLAYSGLAQSRVMRAVFKLTQTLTVSTEKSFKSIKESVHQLKSGTPLCVFAEGGISRLGLTLSFMRGSIFLAQQARVPILPIHIDNAWGSVFSPERGKFFIKKPLSFPYKIKLSVGKPLNPTVVSLADVRAEVVELGRLAFAERITNGADPLEQIQKKIFSSQETPLFQDPKGYIFRKSEFLNCLQKGGGILPDFMRKWGIQVEKLLNGDRELARLVYVNWCRLKNMNLWDRPSLLIDKGDGAWASQWFPWFPLLDNRVIRQVDQGYLVCKSLAQMQHLPKVVTQGLASYKNGLIAINGPDPFINGMETGSSEQPGSKAGTYGRLLAGLSYHHTPAGFRLRGVFCEEVLEEVKGVDKDGFLERR